MRKKVAAANPRVFVLVGLEEWQIDDRKVLIRKPKKRSMGHAATSEKWPAKRAVIDDCKATKGAKQKQKTGDFINCDKKKAAARPFKTREPRYHAFMVSYVFNPNKSPTLPIKYRLGHSWGKAVRLKHPLLFQSQLLINSS